VVVFRSKGQIVHNNTITNITRGQVISPPIVFSHRHDYSFFELGAPASDALVQLAEDGMTVPLEREISAGATRWCAFRFKRESSAILTSISRFRAAAREREE
jgi:hypothetical protein